MAWTKSTRITIMLVIDIVFFILELGVGLVVGSLALMADAFHMLNDIISLLVGLWAVQASQRSSSDKYSFGWLRAEILGAFFNAVFLIALCLSIVLEAITRLIDPPEISNPMLILIVGSLGLASNLAGFFVLGGHGHSHGPEEGGEHGHSHADHSHGDKIKDAEEGHAHTDNVHDHDHHHLTHDGAADETSSPVRTRKFTSSDETASTSRQSDNSVHRSESRQSRKHRRRTSSILRARLAIEDLSIHPASFRQEIIAASRPKLDGIQSEEESDSDVDESEVPEETFDGPSENSPLLSKSKGINGNYKDTDHDHEHEHNHSRSANRPRHDSWHENHNHNKPKKAAAGGHGHNHADMGMRAMVLHVIGDALGNVGVIVAALIIWLTDSPYRFYADPAVSLFITLIILRSTIPLTSATAKILLQATPDHLDVNDIKEDIQTIPGVVSCHHVHIWQLSDSQIIASMHIQVSFPISEQGGSERYMELAMAARKCLHAYGIHSATIQPEFCLDKAHIHHTESLGGQGDATREQDTDSCLLGCVDDCTSRGCCTTIANDSDHDSHDGHSH